MSVKNKIYEMYKAGEITEAQAFKAATFAEDLEKTAGALGLIGKSVGLGTLMGLSEYGIGKAISYGESRGDDARVERMYNDVIRYNPNLLQSDPDKVKDIFKTLAKFAPTLASDPHAASAYIKRIMDFDPDQGADYGVIRTLVQLEKDYQDTRATRLKPAVGAISSGLGNAGRMNLDIGDSGGIAPKAPLDAKLGNR